MKKRLNFRCWNCDREYAMTLELEGKPQIIVTCPFCDKEATVDLDKYREPTTSIYKGETPETSQSETYAFPPVIPTSVPNS